MAIVENKQCVISFNLETARFKHFQAEINEDLRDSIEKEQRRGRYFAIEAIEILQMASDSITLNYSSFPSFNKLYFGSFCSLFKMYLIMFLWKV